MKILKDLQDDHNNLEAVEKIKYESNYLRGALNESLIDEITGAVSEDDTQVTKFHGIYQQTDRSLDSERKHQKLEPLYSFMVRVRVPGGIATPDQWLKMDELSDQYGNGTLKLTTRQAFQFHGVLKKDLKKHIKGINDSLLDTLAACGDVNRNVMCSPNPYQSRVHEDVQAVAKEIHDRLTPKTNAYHEIWLEKKKVASVEEDNGQETDKEPLYTRHYLPRKFKIALAVPPYNDTDIFTNDVGLIAIEENEQLIGFNVVIGGGMGNTIGDERTYPRLGDVVGFIETENVLPVIEAIVSIQRDFGSRDDRKIARLKYTFERMGRDEFLEMIKERSGKTFKPEKKYHFERNGDVYGWSKGTNDKWHLGLFIEGGRIKDSNDYQLKTGLKAIANIHDGDFRLTGNQNLVIANISKENRPRIEEVLREYKIMEKMLGSPLRLNSMACVALYTCPLAHAEAETYLPSLIDKIEPILSSYGLDKEEITIRMTGCPNGCARPYNAEIAFVGRALGIYNMYLGGDFVGTRLNRLYKEQLKEYEILKELEMIFKDFAENRKNKEPFGDFVWRKGYVNEDVPLNI